jgi:predicted metalloprotease
MRWKNRRQSANVEDRRSMSRAQVGLGGGLIGLVVVIAAVLMGFDPRQVQNLLQNVQQQQQQQQPAGEALKNQQNDETAQFVAVVLADTEEVWRELFLQMGKQYREPKLILFRDSVQSACGYQQAAVGPFYCPPDEQVYIDLSFYDDLRNRLGAPGDFAQAYVIAHEVGHHVQNLLGISDAVHAQQKRLSKEDANELSVRLELQADFLAGVWAHHAEKNWRILEEGDIEEALNAAAAIGDDRLQMKARGKVMPESFTHGTSAQRVRWFRKGLKTGDVDQGDTFQASSL